MTIKHYEPKYNCNKPISQSNGPNTASHSQLENKLKIKLVDERGVL